MPGCEEWGFAAASRGKLMRLRGISCLVWGVFIVACLAPSSEASSAANCALYVRAETGVALYGAAGGWWNQAEGRYARGHVPAIGAILVFKRTGHMPSGHVALVTQLVSEHEILVDHANWYHGRVTRHMSVIDTSPNHDWTSVAVLEMHAGRHGRDNPAFGFIYPNAPSPDPGGLFHFAVATEDLGDQPFSLRTPHKR
jgi:surface antigen